jgi:hypothetical protein
MTPTDRRARDARNLRDGLLGKTLEIREQKARSADVASRVSSSASLTTSAPHVTETKALLPETVALL